MEQEALHTTAPLSSEEQILHEVLKSYGNKSILPDKDQAAKLVLLRVFLKKQLLHLTDSEPTISLKRAILTLVSLLPDDSREDAFYLAVSVASRYWPSTAPRNHPDEVMA
jgi:hypothetical protein